MPTKSATTTHTPGPWNILEYVKAETPAVHGAHGIFAPGAVLPIVGEVFGGTLEESDANARLIAAAPELLDALRNILDGQLVGTIDTDAARFSDARALLGRLEDK